MHRGSEGKGRTMSTMNRQSQELADLLNFLTKLGLEEYYPNKLTLHSLFEINKNSIDEKAVLSLEEIPWCFLQKLFKINAECRSCTQLSIKHEDNNDLFELDLYTAEDSADSKVNPLDVIVALFLCADSLLQQEMALKMSLCQFSLPLLLPHGNKSQCALVHWALRDIVKEWCPHDLSESKGFVEENIIQANIPFYSFVRLKNCTLPKSQFLNHLLSSGQQSCSIFTHRDVEGGAVKRQIADGLVEVCWYLPSGKALDIFSEPIGFANLRGDIRQSLTQFNFLFQVSTATFVFLDRVDEEEHRILTSLQDAKSKLFLVVNRNGENAREDMRSVKTLVDDLHLSNNRVKIKDSRQNVTEFSKKLCEAIKTSLLDVIRTISIVNMFDKAIELGLSVDESKTHKQREAAKEIMEDIGSRSIPHYKKQQLPLQGENWKRLAQLEKEECRLKKSGGLNLEEYKLQLHGEKVRIRKDQGKCKVSKGMERFIQYLSTSDKEQRDVFLKWMKLMFNTHSRAKLSVLRNKFKEQCKNKDVKLITELDQALVDSSLGIEHYMRETGLIYEFSAIGVDKISHLPGLAAEMLLDGYPLELLDGDASNIPERWVTDVLMELHKKVGQKSRLLVLTVLGVQSSGKSTLLNTMFGVQFPVSSGRCTRGAFMLFLKVGEDLKSELNCDFIVLIDTEGLKAPDLAQLEDSYEHDNQLATFVIGLSDVTIVNIAMENANEMKDVLQITVHAFLRMKEIGKKPVCHFVHQNVSSVSAHAKTMTERKHLLDQLNEMTQIAADMERKPAIKKFTDVLDYDMEQNNWNIPGLWHGTPPMAPVNTGYSEAVAHFKKHLLRTVMSDRCNEPSQIPEFLLWMKSLWKAVKYENFIFSFRNTLVAHAYDSLCKEFNQWEWEFRKEILTWQTAAELEIVNADNESELETWNRLVDEKKLEASQKIMDQQTIMKEKLSDYYKRRGKRVNLIEKYKAEFVNSIHSLANEIKHSVCAKLDCALQLKISLKQTQDIQRQYRKVIEKQVMKLLGDCNESTLTDKELTQEFEKMWAEAIVNVGVVKEQDIAACVLKQLRRSFSHRKVNEELQNIRDLKEMGRCQFKTTSDHVDSFFGKVQHLWRHELQIFADNIIQSCTQFVLDKVKTTGDYQDSFTKELLETIDKALEKDDRHKTNTQFEIDLKIHMCGIASQEFLKMHRRFLSENDPHSQLEKYKSQYQSDFLDLYRKKDHCQRKANDFVQFCIKPAVKEYISRSLGVDIVDEILTSSHSAKFSSRSYFQYNIQKEMLEKEDFQSFLKYIDQYEMYVKDWIFQHIQEKMTEDKTLCKLKTKILLIIIKKITHSIKWASKGQRDVMLPDDKENITKLIGNMRTFLIKDITISEEAVKATLFQIQSKCHQFISCLKISINELKDELEEEISNSDNITETLNQLPIKPQDELFKRVFGCGKQCPFCSAPCEAGGTEHKEHHAAIHRPQAFSEYRNDGDEKLVATLCTTDVHSEREFQNKDTGWKWHPYKDYTKYYPDWIIPPDPTIEASDYWKYVLVKYNKTFAEEYDAVPADVPEAWRTITKQHALKGLNDAFNVN